MGAKNPEGNNKIIGELENVCKLRLKDLRVVLRLIKVRRRTTHRKNSLSM